MTFPKRAFERPLYLRAVAVKIVNFAIRKYDITEGSIRIITVVGHKRLASNIEWRHL